MKLLLLIIAAAVIGNHPLSARPVDLSEFKGKFKGTTTLIFEGVSYSGPAVMNFAVKKNGRSGSLGITGSIFANGSSLNAGNSYAFAKSKTFSFSYFAPPINNTPLSGAYSVKKTSKILGAAIYSSMATINVTITIKKTKKRATLTVVHSLLVNGNLEPYRITYIGKGKVKR